MKILTPEQTKTLNAKLLKLVPDSMGLEVGRAYLLFARELTASKKFPVKGLFCERGTNGECHWDVKAIMDQWRADEKEGAATPDTTYTFCTGWACNIAGSWINHSWVWIESPDDNYIVDTTTDRHQAYYGIKLTPAEEQQVGSLIGHRDDSTYG
jgi:hypothetical protein